MIHVLVVAKKSTRSATALDLYTTARLSGPFSFIVQVELSTPAPVTLWQHPVALENFDDRSLLLDHTQRP
jgi:hypothetical protein